MEESKRFVRGLLIPSGPWFKPETIEQVMDYRPLDGDALVVSFPKTGTTLTLYTVLQILTKGQSFPGLHEMHNEKAPFMELGMEPVRNLEPPRVYMTHIPYKLQTRNDNAKYIYVYRNPADTVVSMYHFLKGMGGPSVLDEFFEVFVKGQTPYGDFFDHVLTYYRHRNESNIVLVSYEKFVANKEEEILRIAEFLGGEYFQHLKSNADVLKNIVDNTNFDYMKKTLQRFNKATQSSKVEVKFFRKGIVGDGKTTLSPIHMQRLKELTIQKMKGTDIPEEWLNVL